MWGLGCGLLFIVQSLLDEMICNQDSIELNVIDARALHVNYFLYPHVRCVPQDNDQVCPLVLAMSSGQSKTTIGMVHVIIKGDLWMLNNYFQLP